MSIKKQFLKSKNICKVTFRVPKADASNSKKVVLVGSFTDWEAKGIEMKKLKSGDYTTVVNLPQGAKFEYRYINNDKKWFNDSEADSYIQNSFGDTNSVVSTMQ